MARSIPQPLCSMSTGTVGQQRHIGANTSSKLWSLLVKTTRSRPCTRLAAHTHSHTGRLLRAKVKVVALFTSPKFTRTTTAGSSIGADDGHNAKLLNICVCVPTKRAPGHAKSGCKCANSPPMRQSCASPSRVLFVLELQNSASGPAQVGRATLSTHTGPRI